MSDWKSRENLVVSLDTMCLKHRTGHRNPAEQSGAGLTHTMLTSVCARVCSVVGQGTGGEES